MKVRHGFVSNSSTSSFLCDICGTIEAERDLCITDAGMLQCQKDHTFCTSHMEDENPIDIPRSLEEKKQILKHADFVEEGGDIEDGNIEDLYEEWQSEARYTMPSEFCPFCNLQRVTDEFLLLYLFKTTDMSDLEWGRGTTRMDVVKRIREKYGTYDDFKSFVKPS